MIILLSCLAILCKVSRLIMIRFGRILCRRPEGYWLWYVKSATSQGSFYVVSVLQLLGLAFNEQMSS